MKYISSKAQIIVIPIVVDSSRFDRVDLDLDSPDFIAYCGSMHTEKDGVEILIEAFNMIAGKYPILSLKLIGKTDFPGFNHLKDIVSGLKFNSRISFTGWVSNDEMAGLLKQAKVLALARPISIQAAANFPTKIGEYLATGKPVLITKVGIVPEYLQHGVNAYLAEPGNVNDFAEKMEYILDHYDEALKVGEEGRKLTSSVFNHLYQGKLLAEFIGKL